MLESLSHREKEVLKFIVENFISSALPVGSRSISKQTDLNLSSATIRNVMSDLEEMELLKTPHTSAGRVPTDQGLRLDVDFLMSKTSLRNTEIELLKNGFDEMNLTTPEDAELYDATSKILGKISHQLAIVTQPFLNYGVLEKLEMFQISSNRILVVVNIQSGFVRTVIMEIDTEIPGQKLSVISSYLNEKLNGLTIKEIRDSLGERIGDIRSNEPEIFSLLFNSIDKMYSGEEKGNKVYIGGKEEVISQPEFDDPKNFRNIIELTESKDLVVHIFSNNEKQEDISVKIGKENNEVKLKEYSVITKSYTIGSMSGKIGIIGPKRLPYNKMISLIEYTTKLISEIYS